MISLIWCIQSLTDKSLLPLYRKPTIYVPYTKYPTIHTQHIFFCLKSCGRNNLYRWSQPIWSKLSIRHTTTLSISASTDQSSFSKKFQCWWLNVFIVLWENNDTLAVSPASEEMEAYFAQLNLTKNIQEEEKQKTTCVCLPPNIISCCHWYTTPSMTRATSGIAQWPCLHLPAHMSFNWMAMLCSSSSPVLQPNFPG